MTLIDKHNRNSFSHEDLQDSLDSPKLAAPTFLVSLSLYETCRLSISTSFQKGGYFSTSPLVRPPPLLHYCAPSFSFRLSRQRPDPHLQHAISAAVPRILERKDVTSQAAVLVDANHREDRREGGWGGLNSSPRSGLEVTEELRGM